MMFTLLLIMSWVLAEVPPSVDQLQQEVVPTLNGELESLRSKEQAKRMYLSGSGSWKNAFWTWSIQELWSVSTVRTNKRLLMLEHQERLTTLYSTDEVESQNREIDETVASKREAIWMLSNQIDALNLEFLNRLEGVLNEHDSSVQRITNIHTGIQRVIEQQVSIKESSSEVDELLLEKQWLKVQQQILLDGWLLQSDAILLELLDNATTYPATPTVASWRLSSVQVLREQLNDVELAPELQGQMDEYLSTLQSMVDDENARQLELEWADVQVSWKETLVNKTERELLKSVDDLQQSLLDDTLLPLEVQIIQFKLEESRQQLSRIQGVDTERELELSQAKLQEAKQNEQEATGTVELQQEIVRLREIEIAIRSDEANRHREAQTQQAVHIQQHKEIETAIEEWRQLPPLSFDRTQILEELLESINNQKWMLQDYMVAAESEGFDTVESSMEAIEISRVLDDIAEAQRDAILNRTRDQLTAYQSWILLNHHLKDLSALEVNEQHLWSDLTFEWQHIDLVIANHMASVKTKTKDINTWLKWTRSSIFWIIVWFLWRWSVTILTARWGLFVQWFKSQETLLSIPGITDEQYLELSEDPNSLFEPMYRFVSAMCLYGLWQDSWLVSVALFWLLFTGFGLANMIVERWVMDPQGQRSLLSGLNQFVIVLIGLTLLNHICVDVFYAFQTALWIEWFRTVLLFILLIIQLGVWSDFLQEKSANTIGFERLKKWRDQWSTGVFGIRMRALLALFILLCDWSVRIVFWMIEHSSLVGATLARNTLEDLQNPEGTLIDTSKWELPSQNIDEFVALVQQDVLKWSKERRFGAIVVVADEGMGKSAILKTALNSENERSVHMFSVDNVVRNERWSVNSLNEWMLRSMKASDLNTDIVSYLNELPSTIFGIDDVHKLFLRDVSGFEVLNHLFSIVQATSAQHCWIMTCHLQTWSFLRSPATPIQTDLFRTVLAVPPWSPAVLKKELTQMAKGEGLTLNFSSLSQISNVQALHRAEKSYWRLLFDASKGNPSIAKLLFTQSLYQGTDSGSAMVYLFPLMSSESLQELSDDACFVLASILLHDHLRFEELKQSLQMNVNHLQVICRNLTDRAIIYETGRGYEVYPVWLPFVEGMLLQKRFIGQWG